MFHHLRRRRSTTPPRPLLPPLPDLLALHAGSGPGYLLGVTTEDRAVRWDPATDGSLHLLAAAGSGGTHLARVVALQAQANGSRVVVLDASDGNAWKELADSGATVHAAWPEEHHLRDPDARPTAQERQNLADMVRALDTMGQEPPQQRTLLVLDGAAKLLSRYGSWSRRGPQPLTQAVRWLHMLGPGSGVDLVTVAHRPVPEITNRSMDTYALCRVSPATMRTLGLSREAPPETVGQWLVSGPDCSDRPHIIVPEATMEPCP